MHQSLIWGVAISAAQTESAHDTYGKGPSIWDEFCSKKPFRLFGKSKVKNNHHLKDTADFYHQYKTDIDHIKYIGFKHFRFSIAWARIMPDGVNINPEGVEFYKNLIDYCLEQDITPWITLYHWDLPAALEKKGGWTNRDILTYFNDYAMFCVRTYPQVNHWVVLNEPSVFLGAGYLFGIHAPGRKNFDAFLKATHHAMLCIGMTYRSIKKEFPQHSVGSSFSMTQIDPHSNKSKDIKAARIADLLINRFFFEPLLGHGYPTAEVKKMEAIKDCMLPGDEALLPTHLDFIGIQTYTREVFKYHPLNPFLKIKHIPAHKRTIDLTAMNWEIHAKSIYANIMKIEAYQLNIPIIVTENGVAFDDEVVLGRINDFKRIHYFQTHINEVIKAKNEGANVQGYFAWSLIDNFEWAEGYHPRFGLIYVDFITKKRILKESAYWFRRHLNSSLYS
jgi:beta-glucosidase